MRTVFVVICLVVLAFCPNNVFASDSRAANSSEEGAAQASENSHHSEVSNNSSFSGRIVNGKNANITAFPYIVRLRVNNVGFCGASIITYSHAFTAAHCLYNYQNPAMITLYGGSSSQTTGGFVFSASKIVIHPKYNPQTNDYDAAIVQIKKTLQGYKNIAPIPLQDAEVLNQTSCFAAGWGWTNYEGKITPDNLQYAIVQVVASLQCSKAWSNYITPQGICAQQISAGDVCNGDSGGPLVCNGKLTGATSYGVAGCRGQYPAVYTKVMAPSIREFIRTNAGI